MASLRPFQNLHDAPPFELRERTGFHDADPVADLHVVVLVVRVDLGGALDGLGVLRMADALDHRDDRGVVHLVGHHQALADLPDMASLSGFAFGSLRSIGHRWASRASAAEISRSRKT